MFDDIKKTLWATADKLRANMDAAGYRHRLPGQTAATGGLAAVNLAIGGVDLNLGSELAGNR